MSLERDIKETFAMHAGDVRENPDALAEVTTKVTRAHRRRVTLVGAAGIAMLAAAVIAVPKLVANERRGFATTDPTPSSTITTTEFETFRNERDAYQTIVPRSWRAGGFEGSVEFIPPGQVGLTAGDQTFAVEAMLLIGQRYDDDEVGDLSFQDTDRFALKSGGGDRKAVRAEKIEGEAAHTLVYRIDWTSEVCPHDECESATLRVVAFGSTAELWSQYRELGESVAHEVTVLQEPALPGGVTTLHGTVEDAIPFDVATSALVRFMDARVEGGGAEEYMTAQAKRGSDEGLYGEGDDGWQSYEVLQREGADASSFEYTVRLRTGGGTNGQTTVDETIGVGRDDGTFKIRFRDPVSSTVVTP